MGPRRNEESDMNQMLSDVLLLEQGSEEGGELQEAMALQRMVNAGQWSLQGSMGRAMMGAIEAGRCMLGTKRARDYWGNFIPSRDDVKPGTKGSREMVLETMGPEWLAAIEEA